jgi:hypothetical protein
VDDPARQLSFDCDVLVPFARLNFVRQSGPRLLPGERHVSVRLRLGSRRRAHSQCARTQSDPDLEVLRHDDLFLDRLRDELELLRVLFELDRLLDPELLWLELDFVPLARFEPRFEPRLVLRGLRFCEAPDACSCPAAAPAACPACPACCPACPAC